MEGKYVVSERASKAERINKCVCKASFRANIVKMPGEGRRAQTVSLGFGTSIWQHEHTYEQWTVFSF